MDVIRLRAWMLSSENAVDHGRHVATDGVRLDVMLAHGCSVATDGVCLDVIMVGTWMLCGNGRNLSGRYHGWHMGALWERTEFVWTLSWLAHGCSVGTDGICLDVIMVGTWMLCGNGWSLSGRYHGWHMGTLWERTEFVWTLRQGRRFRQSKSSKYRKYQGFGGLHARAAAPPPENTRGGAFSAAKSTKHRKYRCGRPVRGARLQHVGTLNKDPVFCGRGPRKGCSKFGARVRRLTWRPQKVGCR